MGTMSIFIDYQCAVSVQGDFDVELPRLDSRLRLDLKWKRRQHRYHMQKEQTSPCKKECSNVSYILIQLRFCSLRFVCVKIMSVASVIPSILAFLIGLNKSVSFLPCPLVPSPSNVKYVHDRSGKEKPQKREKEKKRGTKC